MHLSNMAICLMDSDKAIGGLYLDADDFLCTGFLCHSYRRLSEKRDAPSCFYRLTIITTICLYIRLTDWLPVYLHSISAPSTLQISPSLSINSLLMQQKENKLSLSWSAPCVWRHMVMVVMMSKNNRESWRREILTGLKMSLCFIFVSQHITPKQSCHS